jgi:hypothetical protein
MKTKMKKASYLGLILLFATATTFAQTTEADIQVKSKSLFLTGVASYKFQEIESQKLENATFEFAKSGGFFVSDNLMLGALAGYSTSTRKAADVKESENNIYSGGVFVRYFYSPTKKYSFFNEFTAVYAHGETTSYDETGNKMQTVDVDGIGGGISLGFVYFITKSFGVQASFAGLTYTSASFDEFENSAAQGFTVGGDLSDLKIGVVFKL